MTNRPDEDVLLIGAGVVGRAIADLHVGHKVTFCLADQDRSALTSAASVWQKEAVAITEATLPMDGLHALRIGGNAGFESGQPVEAVSIVIESIVETLETKQALLGQIQSAFGRRPVLCSNTSTFQINEIASSGIEWPERLCGMHFFMPVHKRHAVEIVRGRQSDADAVFEAVEHVKRLSKHPIECQDGPGFIVNRTLAPYLNQALLLLCRGASADQIERAARAFGMPMSPFELIDYIGLPTMYHSGRAFLRAFPNRLNPSPMIPAMLKRKCLGRSTGKGLYDYSGGVRSVGLSDVALGLVETYRTSKTSFTDGDVLLLLSIPMWIEAKRLLDEGVADSMETVDLAIAGGLGFQSDGPWSSFYTEVGPESLDAAIKRWQDTFVAMRW